jgi:predicted 2-oxoglutarate/Fe(II)-dependent dioxygenase YbiX
VGLYAPLSERYIMDRNIESYLKIYKVLSEEDCVKTVNSLEEKEEAFYTHEFYNYQDSSYHSYDNELSVTYTEVETKTLIMKEIWKTLQTYHRELKFDWYQSWAGYSQIRFNRYRTDTQMKLHCDHIHSMFDGQRKGIPTLSILGALNNDYKGGELVFWNDKVVELKAGEIMIFPSNFLYPHEVKLVTEGTRYSFVSWAW